MPAHAHTISGIPSPPISPEQSNRTCTCVNITWDILECDGSAELLIFELILYPRYNSSLARTVETGLGDATNIDICEPCAK